MGPVVVLGVGVVVVGVAWWRRSRADDRQRELMVLCEHAGLAFAPLDLEVGTTWLPFEIFGRERSGSENVVWNRERGTAIRVFDFWYEDPTDDRARGPRHRVTCGVVPLGAAAAPTRIAPRGLEDHVADAIRGRRIDLELEAFNDRFVVETQDERFAIAFLEQRMMEALLALPTSVTVELNDETVLLRAPSLAPVEVLRLYDAAVAIAERIPRSLASLYPPYAERGPHEQRWLQGRWSVEPTAS
jgi:hypothetical protein